MEERLTPERFRWLLAAVLVVALWLLFQFAQNGRYQLVPDSALVLDTRNGQMQKAEPKRDWFESTP